MKIGMAVIIFAGLFLISGCVMMDSRDRDRDDHRTDRSYQKPGPPPHAPAHGYRHKYEDGHDLEYDSEMGVYIVLRVPDTYFSDNLYIRMSSDGRWLVSTALDRGWRIADGNEIPYKLKKYKESNRKNKSRKNDKHDDDDD